MQTPPRGRLPPRRQPTPQFSERKKRLFGNNLENDDLTKNVENCPIEEQFPLDGIRPLSPDLSNNLNEINLNKSVKIMLKKCPIIKMSFLKDNHQSIDIFTKYNNKSSVELKIPVRQSPRTRATIRKLNNSDSEMQSPQKINHDDSLRNTIISKTPPENSPSSPITPKRNCTDELGKLFKNSLNFKNDKKNLRKEMGSDESYIMSSTDNDNDEDTDSEIQETPYKLSARKRIHLNDNDDNSNHHHQSKILKLDDNNSVNVNNHISIENIKISTKSFYSNKENNNKINNNYYSPSSSSKQLIVDNINKRKSKKRKSKIKLTYKGVHHNIKKPPLKENIKKKLSIDDMLKTIRIDKFKYLPSNRLPQDKINLVHKILAENKNPIEMAKPLNINIHSDEANNLDFSDIDDDNNSNSEESDSDINFDNDIIKQFDNNNDDNINNDPNINKTNKFFKSSRNSSTKKEITITNSIKATFINGKITLKKKKEKKKKSKIKLLDYSFSGEQFLVNEIIDNLNDSISKNSPGKINNQSENEIISYTEKSLSNNTTTTTSTTTTTTSTSTDVPKNNDYSEFSKRLPYKTTDPDVIEQQRLLLNFLITNDICNDENFNIFIADPDNHKEEANKICNSLVCLLDNDEYQYYRNQIPYNTNDPIKIEEQHLLLDFLISNEICTEENFQIFITEPDNHKEKAEKIVNNLINIDENNDNNEINNKENKKKDDNIQNDNNTTMEIDIINDNNIIDNTIIIDKNNTKLYPIFNMDKKCQPIIKQKSTRYNNSNSNNKIKNNLCRSVIGINQYQIDAGQKEYGAKQCSQCGLVYTVHEPEEEILHNEYHQSINILKFRSWIDEDVINNYPEWGNDGRIIRLKSTCSIKKRERLTDVLKIVDKELGFSSYILPSEFVAFLAVRKQQIVGLCLVQFLDSANRYISVNGVDCCTEEDFDARCGISRIWISPLHRRLRIASKLILSVQSHTINGEFIDLDKIAFSSPTEDGKKFAQKITNRNDFLIYQ